MGRLMLLGVEECNYPAVIITAWTVVDARGNFVTGADSESAARAAMERFQARYPDAKFYMVGPRD